MAHYAEIDDNNIVLRVAVMADDLQDGEQQCSQLYGGRWKQTSYNGNIRARYAAPGMVYDETHDVFVYPQPYPSWTLDSSYDWVAPIPKPEGNYRWVEPLQKWLLFSLPTAGMVAEDPPLPQSFIDKYNLIENSIVVVNDNPVFVLSLEMTNNRIFCHGNVRQWNLDDREQSLIAVSNAIGSIQSECQRDVYAYSIYGDEENDPRSTRTLNFSRLVGFTDTMKAVLADDLEHTITIRRYA